MILPENVESNIEKVLEWFDEDHTRCPVTGAQVLLLSNELKVLPSEIMIANRRVTLGLRLLNTDKKKKKEPVKSGLNNV